MHPAYITDTRGGVFVLEAERSITPHIEVPLFARPALGALGFRVTQAKVDKTLHGWLKLSVSWAAQAPSVLRDITCDGHAFTTTTKRWAIYRFPRVKTTLKTARGLKPAIMELGLKAEEGVDLDYSYRFSEPLPEGTVLWFSPLGWNAMEGAESVFRWPARNPKAF